MSPPRAIRPLRDCPCSPSKGSAEQAIGSTIGAPKALSGWPAEGIRNGGAEEGGDGQNNALNGVALPESLRLDTDPDQRSIVGRLAKARVVLQAMRVRLEVVLVEPVAVQLLSSSHGGLKNLMSLEHLDAILA